MSFLITPDAHFHIADVVIDGASQGPIASYTFTNVTAEGHTIAATFAIDTNDITALAGPGGTVTPAGVSAVPWGASLTYTITPDPNHHVVDVLVDGISAGAVASHTFTDVQTPHTIAASFAIDTHQLTYRAGAGGTISDTSPQTVDHGSDGAAVSAVPSTGFHFVSGLTACSPPPAPTPTW